MFSNTRIKPCLASPVRRDLRPDTSMNNRRHDERPEPTRARAVDELRRNDPLLDHHIEELLDAISALTLHIARTRGDDSSVDRPQGPSRDSAIGS